MAVQDTGPDTLYTFGFEELKLKFYSVHIHSAALSFRFPFRRSDQAIIVLISHISGSHHFNYSRSLPATYAKTCVAFASIFSLAESLRDSS